MGIESFKMSASSFSSSVYDCTTDSFTTASSNGRQTENLPLISIQFIEDFLQVDSDSDRKHDVKETSSDKCLESFMDVQSPSCTSSDRHSADQMFNYFFKKIENAEALNNNSELCKKRRSEESDQNHQAQGHTEGSVAKRVETQVSTVCVMEEETMVSAVSSSDSCFSPGETPSYAATPSRRSIDSFDSKSDDMEMFSQSVLREWEPAGDPDHIEVVNQVDNSLNVRMSYSVIRHRVKDMVVRVGDAILLRDPNQQWFERLPQVAEVLKVYQDVPVESTMTPNANRKLHIVLRRYYRSNQLLCVLPDIAIEMASPEAVIFSSSHEEPYNPSSEFVGPCLLLSLNAFYRFWAEIIRLRHGRTPRRRRICSDSRESWEDWLETPDRVFVICGEYDYVGRKVEVVNELCLDL